MRHFLLSTSTLLLLAALAAAPAHAAFFAGDAVDGPNPDIRALGDVDLARDGSGALTYVRSVDGVDRAFVARFVNGAFLPVERVDGVLPGAASQPVVAAADGGRLAVVFVSGGVVYGVVKPQGAGWTAPVALGVGSDPSVDLSINKRGYATFTSDGDVRVARLDRKVDAWTTLAQPADIDPANAAGVGDGRSRVAISADGIGVVTWGEADRVFARKMFGDKLSNAPQDLTPASFDGRVPVRSDLPEVDAEDDSSYAWVVFRQTFADGGSRILARRQRGTAFDAPVAVDAPVGEPVGAPRIDLNGRGVGIASTAAALSGHPMAAILEHDRFGPGTLVFGPSTASPRVVVPAFSENDRGVIGAVLGSAGGAPYVGAQLVEETRLGQQVVLSRPELGPVASEAGFDVATDRASGTVLAWLQGGAADRRVVAGYLDRRPGHLSGYTSQRCCKNPLPRLSWSSSFDLWGAVRYVVSVNGAVVGQTTDRRFQLTTPLKGPTHRWQVTAVDIRGQTKRSRTRLLRVDDVRPRISVGYKRTKRVVTLSVRARDPNLRGHRAAGVQRIVVSWGDRTKGARGRQRVRATHRYRRKGTYPLEVIVTDKAGNERTERRSVRIT